MSDVLSVSSEGVKGVKRRAGRVLATPAVRRIRGEEGVNLSEVEGDGEEGRVLKEDLLRHIEAMRAGMHVRCLLPYSRVIKHIIMLITLDCKAYYSYNNMSLIVRLLTAHVQQ